MNDARMARRNVARVATVLELALMLFSSSCSYTPEVQYRAQGDLLRQRTTELDVKEGSDLRLSRADVGADSEMPTSADLLHDLAPLDMGSNSVDFISDDSGGADSGDHVAMCGCCSNLPCPGPCKLEQLAGAALTLVVRLLFEYDEDLRLTGLLAEGEGGQSMWAEAFVYVGGRLERAEFDELGDGFADEVKLYEYDEKGLLSAVYLDVGLDGVPEQVELHFYDGIWLQRKESLSLPEEVLFSETVFEYEDGLLWRETVFDGEGNVDVVRENIYADGLLSITWFYSDGASDPDYRWVYYYDSADNLCLIKLEPALERSWMLGDEMEWHYDYSCWDCSENK